MDIVASVILVLLPAHVLWHMDLSGVKRKLVMSLFAATFLTLVPCLVNTVYAFKLDSLGMAYSSELEVRSHGLLGDLYTHSMPMNKSRMYL